MVAVDYKRLCTAIANDDIETFATTINHTPELVSHWKPLCDAAFHGKPEFVEVLLDAGADPNQRARTASRHTPLTRITQHHKTIPRHAGHIRCIEILLDHGADPHLVGGPWSWIPLVYASVGPKLDFIERLSPCTDMDIFVAAALGDRDQLGNLLINQSAAILNAQKYSPLHLLSVSGLWRTRDAENAVDCARLLIESGAIVDAVYEIPDGGQVFGATPLWFAVALSENTALAEFLLANGADASVPVFAATYRGDVPTLDLLHQYGANWNQKYGSETPIIELFRYRRTKVVPWLLEHGARATVTDAKHRTLMHLAAIYGAKTPILRALVDHGVQTSARDAEGVTPLEYAITHNRQEVARFLNNID